MSVTVDIKARSKDAIKADRAAGTVHVNSHIATAPKSPFEGDLILFPFKLSTINLIKTLELTVE